LLKRTLLWVAHELDPDAGAMPEAAYQAYLATRTREMPERRALNLRYAETGKWMESNFDTLDHWRRYVAHIEVLMVMFREEGVNPTLMSLGAIRRKNRQMKGLADHLFHT
jgi:hypothetical protein